jgi:hypothetical protein
MGFSGTAEPMGFQLPIKALDLLEECAEADNGVLFEERDDFGLTIMTKASLWNRYPHVLDIDAGHLSAPLDPTDDDQQTRNDVSLSRPNGGFYRSVQLTGKLNVNAPEDDPDGAGTYDTTPSKNLAADTQLSAGANFLRATGTQDVARYPSMHADFTATAYQADAELTANISSLDCGDSILLSNPEVSYDPSLQQVQSYSEHIDLYDWDTSWVTLPGDVYAVGVVGYTTRIDTEISFTSASFVSGTNTKLTVARSDPAGAMWVDPITAKDMFPFNVDVSGVRLQVLGTGNVINADIGFQDKTLASWVPTIGTGTATIATERSLPKIGGRCARVTCLTVGVTGIEAAPAANAPATAAAIYLLSGWIKSSVNNSDVRIAIDWYQANGTTFISTGLPSPISVVANAWTFFSAQVTAPALTAFGRVRMRAAMATIADIIWVDDMKATLVTSYTTDPQTLTVAQVPVNGVVKTVPSGSQVRCSDPWRVAW